MHELGLHVRARASLRVARPRSAKSLQKGTARFSCLVLPALDPARRFGHGKRNHARATPLGPRFRRSEVPKDRRIHTEGNIDDLT